MFLVPTGGADCFRDDAEPWIDRHVKFRRYRNWLPTLIDDLLVAQDKPLIDHVPDTSSAQSVSVARMMTASECGAWARRANPVHSNLERNRGLEPLSLTCYQSMPNPRARSLEWMRSWNSLEKNAMVETQMEVSHQKVLEALRRASW